MSNGKPEFESFARYGPNGGIVACNCCGVAGKPSSTWQVAVIPADLREGSGVALLACGERCAQSLLSNPQLTSFIKQIISDTQQRIGKKEDPV